MTAPEPLKVLFHLHPNFNTFDATGPHEILSSASYTEFDNPKFEPVFNATITAVNAETTSDQNCTIKSHIPLSEAYATLADYDVLIIPGGGSQGVLGGKTEPLGIIQAFAALPKKADGKTRTILSVCTGSLFLAEAGVLDGQSATTHFKFYNKLKEVSQAKGMTEVLGVRFVVNPVNEKTGLRIITSAGVSCGLDSCLWLTGEVAGEESKKRTAGIIEYTWREGVVI